METRQPGREARVPGLGRIAFSMAWSLVEQYHLDVTMYAKRDPKRVDELPKIEPTSPQKHYLDVWNTRQMGVSLLDELDRILAAAVTRHRKESRGAPKKMEEQEVILECLGDEIAEITGFGGKVNHGYELFELSRNAIREWVENEPIPKDNEVFFIPTFMA